MKRNWEYKKLGDVCDILDSKRKPVTKSNRKSGIYPYYGATGIQDYVDCYIFDGRYLLVGEDGAKWGKGDNSAFIIEGKSWVNNHAHILSVHEYISDVFIRYFLNGTDLNSYITGAVVPKLTQAALVSIPIPVPPLEEQSRIVAELDVLTGIIDKQNAQLKELDNLAQAIFYDMFGDPIENPKGWEEKPWGELFDTILGKMLDAKKQNPNDAVRSYLGNTNVQWFSFDLTALKTMTFSAKELEKFALRKGDILLCEGGESGRCAVWEDDNSLVLFQKAIHRARVKDKALIDSHFIPFVIKLMREMGGLKNFVSKATIEHLTGEKLAQVPIILPPLTLQQSFAEKIQSIEKQKETIRASIADTQKLLDYTMDKYFG